MSFYTCLFGVIHRKYCKQVKHSDDKNKKQNKRIKNNIEDSKLKEKLKSKIFINEYTLR